jgi:hypothetical protein
MQTWYCAPADTSGTPQQIALTFNASPNNYEFVLSLWSGLNLSATPVATTNYGHSAAPTGKGSTSVAAGDLVLSGLHFDGVSISAPFTNCGNQLAFPINNGVSLFSTYRIDPPGSGGVTDVCNYAISGANYWAQNTVLFPASPAPPTAGYTSSVMGAF